MKQKLFYLVITLLVIGTRPLLAKNNNSWNYCHTAALEVEIIVHIDYLLYRNIYEKKLLQTSPPRAVASIATNDKMNLSDFYFAELPKNEPSSSIIWHDKQNHYQLNQKNHWVSITDIKSGQKLALNLVCTSI